MASRFEFRDGKGSFPTLSFGTGTTYKNQHQPVIDGVLAAYEAGFRSFDTAMYYGTEESLGVAINILLKEKGVRRDEVFVTTKVAGYYCGYDQTRKHVIKSLEKLNLDYIDLVMMHSPGPHLDWPKTQTLISKEEFDALPRTPEAAKEKRLETWMALQEFVKEGKIKRLGISNFTRFHIEQLVRDPRCTILPDVHQFEAHPYYYDKDVLAATKDNGIIPQAYSPLGNGTMETRKPHTKNFEDLKIVLEDKTLHEIATKRSCTVAQVCMAWLIQKGFTVVTKTSSPKRMRENLDSIKVELTAEDVDQVEELTKENMRLFLDNYTVL